MESLREAVLAALDLHAAESAPELTFPDTGRALVVASGNALSTGRILFDDRPAAFASESVLEAELEREPDLAFAVVISASGEKHAPIVVRELERRGLETYLLTCSADSTAGRLLPPERVTVTPARPEPITYNTATYLGMILAKSREDPKSIRQHLTERVHPLLSDLADYAAFYLLVPARFDAEREMFLTKFDELFGGRLNGRCFTPEQTLHAKTVVPWERELFLSFGEENSLFGASRLHIPLPEGAGYAAMLATGYYTIGRLQESFPDWFVQHAEEYASFQKAAFERLAES